jgi:hypothetical protein|uniref:Uncharacterized protein n=1 Tax=Pseudomonas putida TaxID=303 RepID=A0A7M1HW60_PSEPU|nr:Hypothetical protein [Pseudomonas putida]WJN66815.1 hypothetical protein [Pseudomonas putida]
MSGDPNASYVGEIRNFASAIYDVTVGDVRTEKSAIYEPQQVKKNSIGDIRLASVMYECRPLPQGGF